jgi:tRNA threonylcarbamoyladenosine biosynthesis protein TsaB
VLAVVDARRGEAFVAGFRDGEQVLAPAALAPEALERVAPPAGGGTWLAAGDGAVRFRDALERAGATVLPDIDPAHRISAAATCRLARAAGASPREDVLPVYVRAPDAVMVRRP